MICKHLSIFITSYLPFYFIFIVPTKYEPMNFSEKLYLIKNYTLLQFDDFIYN